MRGRVVVWVLALCGTAAAAPAYDSGGTGTSARFLTDAFRAAEHGRYSEALADDTRAIGQSPSFGRAYATRARHDMDAGRFEEARADLDRVAAMHPDEMSLGMVRVQISLMQGDGARALVELRQALALPLQSYTHQPFEAGSNESGSGTHYAANGHMESRAEEYESIADQLLHRDEASLQAMQQMLKIEQDHPEHILANYCYVAGVAGLLDSAELACDQAISDNDHDVGQYDTEGYVHLRMGQWKKAIADYDRALTGRPDLTISLYGRGVAKRAIGDLAGGDADIAAAKRDEPDIAGIMKRLGVAAR